MNAFIKECSKLCSHFLIIMRKKVLESSQQNQIADLHAANQNAEISATMTFGFLSLLIISVCILYRPVLSFAFVWDDTAYVQNNMQLAWPLLRSLKHFWGLHFYQGNYHPLTMSIYAVIAKLKGIQPYYFHFVVLSIHCLNVLLAFKLANYWTKGNFWGAFWIAAVFALHPLHVESVAWISGLKDVLYAFFFLGASILYFESKGRLSRLNYLSILCLFLLSLCSKPAAVMFPLVLLTFDYYINGTVNWKDVISKIPFLVLSIVFGVLTIKAQQQSIESVVHYNFIERIVLVFSSVARYVFQFIWPHHLSALHPLPKPQELLTFDNLLLTGISMMLLIFLFRIRLQSEMFLGIIFFILMLVLTLQFVTVGMAAYAERYTYIPYVGLSLFFYSFASKPGYNRSIMKWLQWTIGLGLVIIYFFIAKSYIPKWKSEELLWRNVLSQYPESSVANYNLGTYYMMSLNDIDQAFPYFSKAVQLNDKNITAWINLAVISGKRGDIQTAKNCIITAAALDSTLPDLLKNRAYISAISGDANSALADLDRYLNKMPLDGQMYYYRGMLKLQLDRVEEAIVDFSKAINLDNKKADFYYQRSLAEQKINDYKAAMNDMRIAASLGYPLSAEIRKSLGL